VEGLFSIQGHPTTDAFEEYAFKRLSEAETEALEEHILVCPECQTSLGEVDEYILLMKQATASYELRPEPLTAPARWGAVIAASLVRKGPQRSLTYAIGLIAAAAGILLVLGSHHLMQGPVKQAERAAASVELLALRGGAPGAVRAQAERPLDLILDLSGLPEAKDLSRSEAEKYRVEIVNAMGELMWKGEVAQSQGSPSAHLAHLTHLTMGLKAGQYWVRLYSSGALLREFGLRAD
jgi:hypothetical protein